MLNEAAILAARQGNKVINMDAQLTRLQTDGKATVEQIAAYKKVLFEAANKYRLKPENINTGFNDCFFIFSTC